MLLLLLLLLLPTVPLPVLDLVCVPGGMPDYATISGLSGLAGGINFNGLPGVSNMGNMDLNLQGLGAQVLAQHLTPTLPLSLQPPTHPAATAFVACAAFVNRYPKSCVCRPLRRCRLGYKRA